MARLTALKIYKYLPGTNCKECGYDSCMAFAVDMVSKKVHPENCPPLKGKKKEELIKLITEPVKPVVVEAADGSKIKIGGEEVIYRHEERFYNPAAMLVEIDDSLPNDAIKEKIKFLKDLNIERIGNILSLDGVCACSKTGDLNKFKNLTAIVCDELKGTSKILMLASFKTEFIKEAANIARDRGIKPILYASSGNFQDILKIAKEHDDLAVVINEKNPDNIGAITHAISGAHFENIIIDPALVPFGEGMKDCVDKLAQIRKSAIEGGISQMGYPIFANSSVIHNFFNTPEGGDGNPGKLSEHASYYESLAASILLDRFVDLLILKTCEIWAILPLLYLRLNIYTDPRVEPMVEPKIYEIGKPDENSPVLVTTNYALTYFALSGDAESSKVNAWAVVVDTGGLAVLVAVAANKLNGSVIKAAFDEMRIEEKVKHRKLILPGVSASVQGQVEDETGWEVIVGPRDSSTIGPFLKEKWK